MRINPLTSLLAVICLVVTVRAADEKAPADAGAGPAKVRMVGVEEFDRLRANKTNVVLDVRSAAEFKTAHIPGAINIDVRSPDFEKKVSGLDKNKIYLVHCAVGGRSARACQKMEGMGFKELYDLHPGFAAWEKAGKPVEK